jgi:hypothetical protein
MKKLTQGGVIRLLREEYETQLLQKLEEVALFDSRGTMVIGKDLKVIHKPSGFVYTVKGVTGEPGSAKVVLRAPEEPRVQPAASETAPAPAERMGGVAEDSNPEGDDEKQDKRDYGRKAYPKPKAPPEVPAGETMFVIDQKEFEKHYKEA